MSAAFLKKSRGGAKCVTRDALCDSIQHTVWFGSSRFQDASSLTFVAAKTGRRTMRFARTSQSRCIHLTCVIYSSEIQFDFERSIIQDAEFRSNRMSSALEDPASEVIANRRFPRQHGVELLVDESERSGTTFAHIAYSGFLISSSERLISSSERHQ